MSRPVNEILESQRTDKMQCTIQGGEDSQDLLSLLVIFRKSYLHLVALLWKMICNVGDPMSLRHPVFKKCIVTSEKIQGYGGEIWDELLL